MGFVYLFFNKNELLKRISFIWGFGALLSGVLGITALFGIGPFAYVLSDNVRALTDRFYAWLAAIKMIKDNPLYGVGIDNFVDSYRLYRYPEAYEIQTNQPFIDYDNAHNIFLNIGATSGVPTLLAYLGIIIAVTYRGILSLKYHQEKIVVGGLFSIWCIYLINSLVSIDSLGLSVWGWISGGALVSMSMNKNMSNPVTDHNSRTYSIKQRVLVVFIVIISCLPSLYIIPSLINENKLYKYISNIPKLNSKLEAQANLNALFMEAKNTKQIGLMLVAIDYLGYANFLNESQELSKIAVKEFPNSFWAWEFLARSYEIQGDDVSAIPARQKTIELDPLNMIIRQKIVS